MNRFMVGFALVACAMGAPSGIVAPAGYANVGALGYAHGGALVSAPVAHAPAVVGQTHASYAAGPAVVENRVEYGLVGRRTVQTGEVSVVAGHQYAVAGHEAIPQPATSYVAGAPQNIVETVPLAAPVIPAAPAPYAAIPPAPIPAGPAPADTVTQTRIAAPLRTHTRITPQVTNIVPEVVVSKYNVDVPVAVPRAVPREIITHKHVAKPYEVPVPRAVHVAAPYKVHPVQEIIETPHIHHATVETHSTQAVVTAHATPVHAVSQVAVAAPAAAYAAAPAVASVGAYAAAPAVAAGYGYAAAPAAGYGYAAAPAAAAGYGYAAAPAVVA